MMRPIARVERVAGAATRHGADDVDLPVIAAFRLLAAKLAAASSDSAEGHVCNAATSDRDADFLPHASHRVHEHRLASLRWNRRRHPRARRRSAGTGAALELQHSCRRRARGFSKPIMSPVHRAAGRCSTCKPRPRRIKAATLHLKGVKIAIMGCIVNGPGEMADADFGYVGGAPGKVNLYVGKTGGEIQHSRSRSGRSAAGFDSRARQMGGACAADSRARTRFIAQRKLFKTRTRSDSIPRRHQSRLFHQSQKECLHYENVITKT